MANKTLFNSATGKLPRTNTTNEAGGRAYTLPPKQALAQLAATGCFNGTFYASGEAQLIQLQSLISQVEDPVYLAKLAVYARERAFMKDMPAALLVALSKQSPKLMRQVFSRVIDNGRMLRTTFQMIRSGQFGRKCLSSALQGAFDRWLNEASVSKLLSASIGHDPSLRDILRLARPTPKDNTRRALFGWLVDKEIPKWAPAVEEDLPEAIRLLTAFRQADSEAAQVEILTKLDVRWDLLADAAKGPFVWKAIARKMGPQALRMNLNTLFRHQVFEDRKLVSYVANRLADPAEIARSKAFPYQYFAAYLNVDRQIPEPIRASLNKAAELACGNVPTLPGPVVIGLDASGSMSCAVTGNRGRGGTSKVRCVDVAAVFAAAILRQNPGSVVIPFDTKAYKAEFKPEMSVLSVAKKLSKYGGGGTDCSVPIREANTTFEGRPFAGIVLVSDSESWVYKNRSYFYGVRGASGVMTEWQEFVKKQVKLGRAETAGPKLVCIDIQPYTTVQAPDRSDILNVGGFSDAVFNVVDAFLASDESRFVTEVESVEL